MEELIAPTLFLKWAIERASAELLERVDHFYIMQFSCKIANGSNAWYNYISSAATRVAYR